MHHLPSISVTFSQLSRETCTLGDFLRPPQNLFGMRELILQLQPDANVHADQLLHKELGRVRHRHLGHFPCALASVAVSLITEKTTLLANIDSHAIGADHETFEEKL